MLTHEETFVSQRIKTYTEGKLTINHQVDALTVARLGGDGGDDARLWVWLILRRSHRRRQL
jgi:hypothetical protein